MGRDYLENPQREKASSRQFSFKWCLDAIPSYQPVPYLNISFAKSDCTSPKLTVCSMICCFCCSRMMAWRFGERTSPLHQAHGSVFTMCEVADAQPSILAV